MSQPLGWWVVWTRKGVPWPDGVLTHFFSHFPVLFAMKEDNEKVPTLLTDYILKGKNSARRPGMELPPEVPASARSPSEAFLACPDKMRGGRSKGFCLRMLQGDPRRRHCPELPVLLMVRSQQRPLHESSGEFVYFGFSWEHQVIKRTLKLKYIFLKLFLKLLLWKLLITQSDWMASWTLPRIIIWVQQVLAHGELN